MRDGFRTRNILLLSLAVVSTGLYLIDYFIIGNARDLAASFIGNLAFLPLYVMLVTMMVERIMRERERQTIMRKLNMVIGVFFSEAGNHLLKELSACVSISGQVRQELLVSGQWGEADFRRALAFLTSHDLQMDCRCCDIGDLKEFLMSKRSFMVGLLENQNLLEHEQFTELLWAVFHLMEELEARRSFDGMPHTDVEHINGDIKRAFGYLSHAWVLYMKHLKQDYPYLFSLAVRMNPMIEHPDPQVC
ncbi:hypothetical protein [Geobacter sp. SVR]|uniref:hypothetical protein n=1 Tax=Geobacter sp. SVR TaxID=2495594 RepID=UPI00143EFBF1|nr:hypothetical protein [Geobacter sp. SVR]BCS53935.1 hypothetical protein GSVR_22430 [Geobacter sp. SVR]GCF86284.1 hypothetical protein GSbR_28840 [Geobacter sp. SVR]